MKIKQILFTIMVCGVGLVSNSYAQSPRNMGHCRATCLDDESGREVVIKKVATHVSEEDCLENGESYCRASAQKACAKLQVKDLPGVERSGWTVTSETENEDIHFCRNPEENKAYGRFASGWMY